MICFTILKIWFSAPCLIIFHTWIITAFPIYKKNFNCPVSINYNISYFWNFKTKFFFFLILFLKSNHLQWHNSKKFIQITSDIKSTKLTFRKKSPCIVFEIINGLRKSILFVPSYKSNILNGILSRRNQSGAWTPT